MGPSLDADGTPEIDGKNRLAVPGFVNAHMHSGENLNPGLFENLPLDIWFVHSHQVTRHVPPTPEAIYTRTALGAMQMMRTGTTTAIDFLYEAPYISMETLDAVARAYRDIGMRVTISLGFADRPYLESLPLGPEAASLVSSEAPPARADAMLELAGEAVGKWHSAGGMIDIGMAPSAPQRCTPEFLSSTHGFAMEHHLTWHTHALETKSQALTAQRWLGRSFIEQMHDMRLLGEHSSVVHAVWLSDRDIEILAETGTTMIHCLLSNLRLGDGIAPLPELLRHGVRVALGTDGRGCDETLDMIELAKMTALIHKVHGEPHEGWVRASQSLDMITANAAVPAGRKDHIGKIQPGYAADLVLFDTSSIPFTPLNDPVRQVVYGSASGEVATVIIDGKITYDAGRFTQIDGPEIIKATAGYASEEASASGDPQGAAALEVAVRKMLGEAEGANLGIDSYIGRRSDSASSD
ncbi:MAG: amidohydrolase family protein [Actinobacteria bacterium]|nr:amidohydrolase family protein [Actinomycetota bacterium]